MTDEFSNLTLGMGVLGPGERFLGLTPEDYFSLNRRLGAAGTNSVLDPCRQTGPDLTILPLDPLSLLPWLYLQRFLRVLRK